MAYVKLDKELATAVATTLEDINEQISITLSSLSSSFLNKKVSIYADFLIKRDEFGEEYANFQKNAISHNSAADSGSQRAISLKNSITATISKVVTSLNKVVSLVETFESQSGISLEAEMGVDLSSAFQFLAVYGDASSLSDLKGSGMFGTASLNGIYSFDDSVLNFDGLSVWSTFGGFLNENEEETEGEAGLENDIREFFLGKLEGYINEDGDVIIDGNNLGTLNSLSMATLLETDAGQQMKSEFEADYKDKLSMLLYGEAASNNDEMEPFVDQAAAEAAAAAGAVIAGSLANDDKSIVNSNDKNSSGKDKNNKKDTESESTESLDETIEAAGEVLIKILNKDGEPILDADGNEIYKSVSDINPSDFDDLGEDRPMYIQTTRFDENGNEIVDLVPISENTPVDGPSGNADRVTEGFGNESELGGEVVNDRPGRHPSVEQGVSGFEDIVDEFGNHVENAVTDSVVDESQTEQSGEEVIIESSNNAIVADKIQQAGADLIESAIGNGEVMVNVDSEFTDSTDVPAGEKVEVVIDTVHNSSNNTITNNSSSNKPSVETNSTPEQTTPTSSGPAQSVVTGSTSSVNSTASASKPVTSTGGDGTPTLNVDTDGDALPEINIDTNGDGKADINIDTGDSEKTETDTSMESSRNDSTKLVEIPSNKNNGGSSTSTSTAKPAEPVETPKPSGDGELKGSATIAAGAGAAAIIGSTSGSSATSAVPSVAPTVPTVDVNVPTSVPSNPTPVTTTPTISADSSVNTAINSNTSTPVVNSSGNAPTNAVSNTPASNSSTVNSGSVASDSSSSTNQNVPSKGTSSSATGTTHSTESSSSNNSLGKGKSSYSGEGSTNSSSSSSSNSKSNATDSKSSIERQEQTKVEDFDKKVDLNPEQGILGDSSYAELIVKNEKEVKIATGITVSSLAVTLALKITNVIGIVSCVLVMMAISLVYSTFRIKKGKERKKLESLIKIEKINKEKEVKELEEKQTEKEKTEENVIYQEEVVYVDENGNEIELTEDAQIVSEEIIVEEEVAPVEEVIPEKKEFQSAEEVIYGDNK